MFALGACDPLGRYIIISVVLGFHSISSFSEAYIFNKQCIAVISGYYQMRQVIIKNNDTLA